MKLKLFSLFAVSLFTMNMLAQQPPTMGWSSWNTYAAKISESIIKGQADAMVRSGLDTCGYKYINIDDGFQKNRDRQTGRLIIDNVRFPNGLKPVVDHIHKLGLKAGIYSDAGHNTCASFYGGETGGVGVGLLDHEDQDCEMYFNELEFDFIKVDFCGGNASQNSENLMLDPKTRYTSIAEAIKRTGRDVQYNVCRWDFPGTWVMDIADSWRVTQDIWCGWASVKDIIGQGLYLSAYCVPGHYNDLDMLEVGRTLTKEEDRTHFGMWCMLSSPLLIGCDIAAIDDETRQLLGNTELIAINQDSLAQQAYVVQHSGDTYVLVRDIEQTNGMVRAVAFYNSGDSESMMKVNFSDLDLGGNVLVRDLYEHQDMGTKSASMSVTVPAHGCRIYRLEAEKRYERMIYEGETAYLTSYQELKNNQSEETAIYEKNTSASGGMVAGWLGRKADNDLQWRNVYVREDGDYTLTLAYICNENRSMTLAVNGVDIKTQSYNSGSWTASMTASFNVHLHAGCNTVRLYTGAGNWMPSIDYMKVVRQDSQEAFEREVEIVRSSFRKWYDSAAANLSSSIEGQAATQLMAAMTAAQENLDKATTMQQANSALSDLQSALRAFLRDSNAQPREGEKLDMTLLIVNNDFEETTGWIGSPTYKYSEGEFWNKTFNLYQNIINMKPGNYELHAQAFYRTGENDYGAAYKAGTEVIPAKLYANTTSQSILSLYSYIPKNIADYEFPDSKNGYINSMALAQQAFLQGEYENTLFFELKETASLKIGLQSTTSKYDNWCCFDNFRLYYLGDGTTTSVSDITTTNDSADTVYYDLSGRPTRNAQKGIYIHKGKRVVR